MRMALLPSGCRLRAYRTNPIIFRLVEAVRLSHRPKKKMTFAIPMLVCRDAAAEIDFCRRAFDAIELSRRAAEDGSVVHATLKIGAAVVMVHDESPHLASRAPQSDGSSSVVIYLYGAAVDPVIERAIAAGARVLLPAADQFWGDRVGRIVDPAGHVWNVAAHISKEPNHASATPAREPMKQEPPP